MKKLIFFLFIPVCLCKWNFLIYMSGDQKGNSLEEPAKVDFQEMSMVGSNQDINIIVEFDVVSTQTMRFLVKKNSSPTVEYADLKLGERNLGKKEELIDFLNWAFENYSATFNALVLWNHGGGWRSYKGVVWDEIPFYDFLKLNEVSQALEGVKKKLTL